MFGTGLNDSALALVRTNESVNEDSIVPNHILLDAVRAQAGSNFNENDISNSGLIS